MIVKQCCGYLKDSSVYACLGLGAPGFSQICSTSDGSLLPDTIWQQLTLIKTVVEIDTAVVLPNHQLFLEAQIMDTPRMCVVSSILCLSDKKKCSFEVQKLLWLVKRNLDNVPQSLLEAQASEECS